MVDIIDAAGYVVQISYKNKKYSLTNLKLQKILYLVQGWSYVWDGVPAFAGDFALWGTGPVSQKVHDIFSKYGRDEIPICEGKSSLSDKNIEETIDAVWEEYGRKSAYDIVELVRKLIPNKCLIGESERISDEMIERVFRAEFPC